MVFNRKLTEKLSTNLDKLSELDKEVSKEFIGTIEPKNLMNKHPDKKVTFSDHHKRARSFSEKRELDKASLKTQENKR